MTEPAWDRFADQYDTLYGQVRTHVVHEHLRVHLGAPPARIVDVGGGAGHQAIPLARSGYEVTIVDPSPLMLTRAASRLETEPEIVASRVELCAGDGEDAPLLVGSGCWDAVLCHGVVMYLDDPAPMLSALAELARPGAVVSIVAKNARTLVMRPAVDRNWTEALSAFDADRQVNGLGVDTRAETVEELSAALDRVGIDALAWYGVRLFTEGWGRGEAATDPVDEVLAVELEASRRDPYRQLSRLFHLVGRRR